MKKLALLLVLALILGMCSTTALAATSGSCGTNITWRYSSSTKTLTITCNGEGAMTDYRDFDSAPWYQYRNNIEKVEMTGYITYIGKYNFNRITADFRLPDTVKRINSLGLGYCHFKSINMPAMLETIDQSAFEFSTFDQPVVIPDGVLTIPDRAFTSCSIPSITLPSSLKAINDGAFRLCSGLNELELPEGLTTLGDAAFFNSGVKSVTIPASLTSFGSNVFGWCYSLEAINVAPDNPILSSVDGMLFNKEGTILKQYPSGRRDESYTVPAFVTKIEGGAFQFAQYLQSISLHDGITSLPSFYKCKALNHVDMPASITTIFASAFAECTALTELTIPAGVTSIGNIAFLSSGLRRLTIPETVVEFGNSIFSGVPEGLTLCVVADSAAHEYALEQNLAVEFIFPFGNTDFVLPDELTVIEDEAFAGIDASVVFIPDGVTQIGSRVFANCEHLKHINLPESVASISPDAFSGCGTVYLYGAAGGIAETFAASCDNAEFIPLEP